MDEAKCFVCMTEAQRQSVELYLLCQIAGVAADPDALAAASACLNCLSQEQKESASTYLLCQIVNA